ncbi:eCIS core domain-containing protein [Chitinophaga defluvii]|uniref:DUF4157 domain-containing protein n=1 Tax=Chitinophaga defluvii TaxID=3163343 RepID=A0ABV2T2S6_9BACT
MIKATDTKSAAKPAHTADNNSTFFGKESGDAFFAGSNQSAHKHNPFFVQTKLRIGKPNDHYETEADTVADKVVQRLGNKTNEQTVQTKPVAPLSVSRISQPLPANDKQEKLQQKEEQEATEESLQRKPIFDSMADPPPDENIQRKADGGEAPASAGLQQRLHSTKGGGQALPEDTRSAMESSMGADFSQVKVHTGAAATSLSNDLHAQAFTHGRDIYFNEGKFDPSSTSGKHLLAHELTHTIQQGVAHAQQTATDEAGTIRKAGKPGVSGSPAAAGGETVNIAGGNFNPSEQLKEEITASGNKGLDVGIVAGTIAGAGTIRVKMEDGQLQSVKNAYLPLNVPFLAAASPTLAVSVENGQVKGFGTIGNRNEVNTIPKWLKENEGAISWLTGINVQNLPVGITNTFEGGIFTLLLTGVKVKVGGFADATMDVGFENMKPTVHVVASIDVKGMAQSNLDINMKEGALSGEGTFAVAFASFSGNIEAKFTGGVMDVKGTVGYAANKLEGSLTLVMTDQATADNFARSQLGVDPQEAQLPSEVPAAGDKPGPRALAGMGTLTFNLTEWFAGSVNVIVDGKGRVTVIGKIAPPKEIILFEQKDYIKELFKLEARASYGVPLIGNVFVFANVSLSALAKIGPAKIYNIEVAGTYSTDPAIAKSITLSGSLNMSAYAGLRLRAEGGAGLQLLGHDLKLGVGVNADAGVKGYVDARPTIGYRDPGEFFFKGHMEIAAQPFLGLSGDLFVELDSPWWSPIPDNKWTWPIGSLEYPLPGEFGIGADMEYVLGSGKIPEISFSEAKFDGAKFMTDLVDDHVPKKGGGDKGDKAGKYVDGGAATPAPGKAQTPGASDKGGKKSAQKPVPGGKGKDKKGPDADKNDEMKRFGEAMKKVKELESHKPMTKAEITAAIDKIKAQYKISTITIAAKGTDSWMITGSLKGKGNKQSVKVKANMQPGDDKPGDKEKDKQVQAGIKALEAEDRSVAKDGKMKKEEAEKVAKKIQHAHSVFKSITVVDEGEMWEYDYIQAKGKKTNVKVKKDMGVTPKVGEHTVPEDEGVNRESHHVPENELSSVITDYYERTGTKLANAIPDSALAASLIKRADEIKAAYKNGDNLSAILIHEKTHRTSRKGVHRSAIQGDVLADIKKQVAEEEEKRVVIIKKDGTRLAAKLNNIHWQAFLKAYHDIEAANEKKAGEELATETKSKDELLIRIKGSDKNAVAKIVAKMTKELIEKVEALKGNAGDKKAKRITMEKSVKAKIEGVVANTFKGALDNATTSLSNALKNSENDGDKTKHAGKVSAVKTKANNIWGKNIVKKL